MRQRRRLNIRLRYILTIAFTLVAVIPVIAFGYWIDRTALKKEMHEVREKHLLLADQTETLLNHYAADLNSAFTYFSGLEADTATEPAIVLAKRLGLFHFCIFDNDHNVVWSISPDPERAKRLDERVFARLRIYSNNVLTMSPVMKDRDDKPMLYMVRRIGSNRVALAAVSTTFLRHLQSDVSFGTRGHAVIVDQNGNVIAHPNDAMHQKMINLATLEPVKRMMVGERGITEYYSPSLKLDMVAAYTTEPKTGWGVMVVQPIQELSAKADDIKFVALLLIIFGIPVAAFVSWTIADRLTRPIEAVQITARRIANGKLQSRVPPLSRLTASDLRELASGFNNMAQRIQNDQTALESALSRAQSADQAKTRFLANMSHELRTPLNAIIGFSQTMENELFGPIGNKHYSEYAKDIRSSGEHLLSIINYILDLSKIEGGTVQVEDDVVNVAELIRSVHAMLQSEATDGDIVFTTQTASSVPNVRGSEVKLKQVLVNLASNAIKYTPAGGSVEMTAWQNDDGGVSIRVSDTGIGLSKADLTTALIPFGRVESEMSERVNGAGLGLPLAKRFTEIHGGTLQIESARGTGTTMTVRLPPARTVAEVA